MLGSINGLNSPVLNTSDEQPRTKRKADADSSSPDSKRLCSENVSDLSQLSGPSVHHTGNASNGLLQPRLGNVDSVARSTPAVVSVSEGIRAAQPALSALTPDMMNGPWEDVMAFLNQAIPEAGCLNGPAAESAEVSTGAAKGPEGSASEALYGHFWGEADRAWGGLQTFHAVYRGSQADYMWLTQKQKPGENLSHESFKMLHDELLEALPANDHTALQGLVWGILCNDLGKTEALSKLYQERFNKVPPDHDRLMGELLEHCPEYFPAFSSLHEAERLALIKGFSCGCDIAQLAQLETAPAELEGFKALTLSQRKLYVLHSKYDIAGAVFNFMNKGSITLGEATHKVFRAIDKSLATFTDDRTAQDVYEDYVLRRACMIGIRPDFKDSVAALSLDQIIELDLPLDALLKTPLSATDRLTAIVAGMTRRTQPFLRQEIEMALGGASNELMRSTLAGALGKKLHIYYGPALLLNAEPNLAKQMEAPASPSLKHPALTPHDKVFDSAYAMSVNPDFNRSKVEGLWMGLELLAQSIRAIHEKSELALGRIADTDVRELNVGLVASALKRPAIVQPGHALPVIRLQTEETGAGAMLINQENVGAMKTLASAIAHMLGTDEEYMAGFTVALRGLPEAAQDLLGEVFILDGAAQEARWSAARDLFFAMWNVAPKALSHESLDRRYLITLAQCVWVASQAEASASALRSQVDLRPMLEQAELCLDGGVVKAQEVGGRLQLSIKPHLISDVSAFPQMKLSDVPGKKVICVGIGGTDGMSSAQVAMQLKKLGKEVAAVLSVRGSFTGSPSSEHGIGEVRKLEHVHEVVDGVYRVGRNTYGPGRMFENLAADDVPMHVLIDAPQRDVRGQMQALLGCEEFKDVDTIITVNTSGRVFEPIGQEGRVLRSIGALDGVHSVTAILPLLTGSEFEGRARRAGAKFARFSEDQRRDILGVLRRWELDGRNANRWGNGPLTWTAALQSSVSTFSGDRMTAVIPYPAEVVMHPEQPRNPFKGVNASMLGVFFMDTAKVLEEGGSVQRPALMVGADNISNVFT